MTACTLRFSGSDNETVSVDARGYIRAMYRDAIVLSLGWVESIQADNDAAPAPAMLIQVLEVSSLNTTEVPPTRNYILLDSLDTPPELLHVNGQPTAVVCYLEPGTPNDPPILRRMKRVRVNVN